MKLGNLFKNFHLEKVRLNLSAVQLEVSFQDADKDAAWELYVEMLTRIVTQPLPMEEGDDEIALESVHSLFQTTRDILRRHGRESIHFSRVAIPVLNQVVRPFTAKWHRVSLDHAFDDEKKVAEFRTEMEVLRHDLRNFNRMLSEIAGVEDLTDLELTGRE